MANAASTPEFKKILNDLYASGKYRKSSQVLKEAWQVYKSRHGSTRKNKARHNPIAIYNPGESRPRIKFSKKAHHGVLRPHSPFKGYKINAMVLLPMQILEIRYRRKGGSFNGEFFKHKFPGKSHWVYGMPDGSLVIKGMKRLWGTAN